MPVDRGIIENHKALGALAMGEHCCKKLRAKVSIKAKYRREKHWPLLLLASYLLPRPRALWLCHSPGTYNQIDNEKGKEARRMYT